MTGMHESEKHGHGEDVWALRSRLHAMLGGHNSVGQVARWLEMVDRGTYSARVFSKGNLIQ